MSTLLKIAAPLLALALGAVSAQAAPVTSIEKLYGSAAGRDAASTGGSSCDTLGATSITVRDTNNGCQRFHDAFDFSGANLASIDSFKLTLEFSDTNSSFIFPTEYWQVRPAYSGTQASSELFDINRVGGWSTQSFVFDSTLDIFDDIVNGGQFHLWFAEQSLGADNFQLASAKLEVFGTENQVAQVPEPGSLALVGLGVLGLALTRRRQKR